MRSGGVGGHSEQPPLPRYPLQLAAALDPRRRCPSQRRGPSRSATPALRPARRARRSARRCAPRCPRPRRPRLELAGVHAGANLETELRTPRRALAQRDRPGGTVEDRKQAVAGRARAPARDNARAARARARGGARAASRHAWSPSSAAFARGVDDVREEHGGQYPVVLRFPMRGHRSGTPRFRRRPRRSRPASAVVIARQLDLLRTGDVLGEVASGFDWDCRSPTRWSTSVGTRIDRQDGRTSISHSSELARRQPLGWRRASGSGRTPRDSGRHGPCLARDPRCPPGCPNPARSIEPSPRTARERGRPDSRRP